MPFKSKAQQGYMHAAAARGEIPKKVVREFDAATSKRQFARMPERVDRDAHGGLAGRLAQRYFRGGEAPADAPAEGEVCQHYFHGGAAKDHSPSCYDHPEHPMYRGGDVEGPEGEDEDEEVSQSGEGSVHIDVYSHGAEDGYAQGGQAEEAEQHLEGADWQDDERNRERSPLAERLSGARMKPGALTRILRKPGSRVP